MERGERREGREKRERSEERGERKIEALRSTEMYDCVADDVGIRGGQVAMIILASYAAEC